MKLLRTRDNPEYKVSAGRFTGGCTGRGGMSNIPTDIAGKKGFAPSWQYRHVSFSACVHIGLRISSVSHVEGRFDPMAQLHVLLTCDAHGTHSRCFALSGGYSTGISTLNCCYCYHACTLCTAHGDCLAHVACVHGSAERSRVYPQTSCV